MRTGFILATITGYPRILQDVHAEYWLQKLEGIPYMLEKCKYELTIFAAVSATNEPLLVVFGLADFEGESTYLFVHFCRSRSIQ